MATKRALIKIAVRSDTALPGAPGSLIVAQDQEAEVHGEFAIWRIKYGWNLTHVRTGLRLFKVYGNKAKALRTLEILTEAADWAHGEFGKQAWSKDEGEWFKAVKRAAEFLYPKPQQA